MNALREHGELGVQELTQITESPYNSVCTCVNKLNNNGDIHRVAGRKWSLKPPPEDEPSPFRTTAIVDEILAGNDTKEGIMEKLNITEEQFHTTLRNIRGKGMKVEKFYRVTVDD